MFGRDVAADVKDGIAADLPKGIAAVNKLVKFSPWIASNQFTYADLSAYWAFSLASLSAKQSAGIDLFAAVPGSQAWYDGVAARPSVKQALADQAAARKARG